ncbi:MAG: response regulator [Candidatus Hydrogenedentes bacterium]|nr:response regulator [Candidatus Hydrogenedentota bacterium]
MTAAHTILVVEDEPAIADTITYALRTEGFNAVWCATAAEAQRVFTKRAIDLIVLDVGLPDQNGFEFCQQIRKTSTVPIIFLTARSGEIDRVVGLEIGADDYVAKPFSPRELAARVKAVLRRASAVAGSPDHATPPTEGLPSPLPATSASSPSFESVPVHDRPCPSPFRIDKDRLKIFYFNTLLDLSRYEYRLLEVLLHRPGWVYSRDKLMEMAWEYPESSMDRTVDTHIKTIRAKLRQVRPDIDPIQTHRGLGYSLRETW